VSLWPVADVVARTEMELFYRDLTQKSIGKAAALAAAQREIILQLRKGRIVSPRGRVLEEHPVFWAPFVLLGDAR
jgi:CHAT domain-containing protein